MQHHLCKWYCEINVVVVDMRKTGEERKEKEKGGEPLVSRTRDQEATSSGDENGRGASPKFIYRAGL